MIHKQAASHKCSRQEGAPWNCTQWKTLQAEVSRNRKLREAKSGGLREAKSGGLLQDHSPLRDCQGPSGGPRASVDQATPS